MFWSVTRFKSNGKHGFCSLYKIDLKVRTTKKKGYMFSKDKKIRKLYLDKSTADTDKNYWKLEPSKLRPTQINSSGSYA